MIIKRPFYLSKINAAMIANPVTALIGARQVGKTTLMQSLDYSGKKLFINGQNPEVIERFTKLSVLQQYLQVELDENLEGLLLIDEFQYIPQISTMMKLLVDKFSKLKIVCSGSSSIDMQSNLAESLAGRVRVIPVFSLSFFEYLEFFDHQLALKYEKYPLYSDELIIDKQIPILLKEYLLFGGLPKVALTPNTNEKIELLNDIYQTYLLKDVRNYIKNEDFTGFNKLLKLLSAKIGDMVNINELSLNSGLKYRTCEQYLNILQQMYIIEMVTPFTTNKRSEITSMKKVYYSDIGLRNIVYNSFNDIEIRIDNGAIFENFVFLELLKTKLRREQIFYYRTKDGTEIDFIVDDNERKIILEVKFKKLTKPFKIRAFTELSKVWDYNKAFLISRNFGYKSSPVSFVCGYFVSKIFDPESL